MVIEFSLHNGVIAVSTSDPVLQVFGCRKKMSAIAILDYGGANELFNQMSVLAKKGRADYLLYYNEDEANDNSDIDAAVSPETSELCQVVCKQRHTCRQNTCCTISRKRPMTSLTLTLR